MTRRSLRLGQVLGVELRLDYSWFIVFVLVAWMLAGHHFPLMNPGWAPAVYWAVGLVASVLFFASVVAHELGHSTVSRALGVPVRDITLFIFGGAARLGREPQRPRDEFLIAAAGPLVSLILGGVFWAVGRFAAPGGPTYAVAAWLAWINAVLAIFNLIPGFPLDGGRVFRAAAWAVTGNFRQATRVAALLGRVVAFLIIVWGASRIFAGDPLGGLWITFIGWFLDSAAARSVESVALTDLLAGHTVNEVVMTDCPRIAPDETLDVVVDQKVLPTGRRCLPVVEGDALRGLLTLHRIKEIPRDRWRSTRARDVMIGRAELRTVHPTDRCPRCSSEWPARI